MHSRVDLHVGSKGKLPRLIALLVFSKGCFSIGFHGVLDLCELVHEIAVLLGLTAEPRHMFAILENIPRFILILVTVISRRWLVVYFGIVRECT